MQESIPKCPGCGKKINGNEYYNDQIITTPIHLVCEVCDTEYTLSAQIIEIKYIVKKVKSKVVKS